MQHLLLNRMCELRSNVPGHDAGYLAVVETFDCALVTADARLASIPDLRCEVRLALPPEALTAPAAPIVDRLPARRPALN